MKMVPSAARVACIARAAFASLDQSSNNKENVSEMSGTMDRVQGSWYLCTRHIYSENEYLRVHQIEIYFSFHTIPLLVLILFVPTKMYCCCLQPTRAAAGERRRASKNVIHTGCSGISHVQRRAERSINTHGNQVRYIIYSAWYYCCV